MGLLGQKRLHEEEDSKFSPKKKLEIPDLTAPIVGEAAGRRTLVIRVLVSGPSFKLLLGR